MKKLTVTAKSGYLSYLKRLNKTPTLTIRGFIIYCTDKVSTGTDRKFDWENAIIDAVIISGVTFFSTLGGGTVTGLDSISGIKTAVIAAFAQFFIFLALKRGIVHTKECRSA